MRRIRIREFGGPEVLVLEEADDLRPEAGEALIRVKAAGENPYDTYMRRATTSRFMSIPTRRRGMPFRAATDSVPRGTPTVTSTANSVQVTVTSCPAIRHAITVIEPGEVVDVFTPPREEYL